MFYIITKCNCRLEDKEVAFLSYPKELGEETLLANVRETKKVILEMSKRAEKQVRKANELIKRLRESK